MVAFLWVAFPIVNFSESQNHRPANSEPILDFAHVPSLDTEIVISMYQEPIKSVNFLVSSLRSFPAFSTARVHIYTKDKGADVVGIQQQTRVDNVTRLPNIGREGETYLYHILSQWDSLAKHTIFVQGDIHNPREFFPRVRDFFDVGQTGILSIGFSGNICNCHKYSNR